MKRNFLFALGTLAALSTTVPSYATKFPLISNATDENKVVHLSYSHPQSSSTITSDWMGIPAKMRVQVKDTYFSQTSTRGAIDEESLGELQELGILIQTGPTKGGMHIPSVYVLEQKRVGDQFTTERVNIALSEADLSRGICIVKEVTDIEPWLQAFKKTN